jgi:hypothetical protein
LALPGCPGDEGGEKAQCRYHGLGRRQQKQQKEEEEEEEEE